jgi:Icc-related predicted phosphoesterase
MAIFAGDAGSYRNPVMNVNGVLDFIEWYSSLKNIKDKVWVAGNHDTSIENGLVDAKKLSLEKGLIYLQHESGVVNGIEIFGSPYTPSFGVGWAFNVSRNKILNYWEEIPKTTEILVIHGGAKGLGGLNIIEEGEDVGCDYLKGFLETLPNLEIFIQGHIHEGYGVHQINNGALLVNASVLNRDYKLVNKPYIITFDVKAKKIINIEN